MNSFEGLVSPARLRHGRAMSDSTPAPPNSVEISVSELSNALKRTLEDRFGYVRVRGEISGYRGPHSSGHAYFSIKDAGARLDAVIWKGAFNRMRIRPEEGMEVVATGKITTFANKSSYQIVVEAIEPAGVGALMALLDARRKKLEAEGLFASARKRPLPYLPRVIGVVTSPTGAVIRDILHRLADRFPVHVLVWPVRVQGETAAAEVAAAIQGFNGLLRDGAVPRPDVLIVARGGGSLEDLWGFNEEIVVRAAAASEIPVVSAVGHETDWTLIDHAADVRAPTPTAAAEMCVPVRGELLLRLSELESRQRGAALRTGLRRRTDLRALARALPSGDALLAGPRQRTDAAAHAFRSRWRQRLDALSLGVARLSRRLGANSPGVQLARAREVHRGLHMRWRRAGEKATLPFRERLASVGESHARESRRSRLRRAEILGSFVQRWSSLEYTLRRRLSERVGISTSSSLRLRRAFQEIFRSRKSQLQGRWQLLAALSYRGVLARGFALVHDANGRALRRAAAISPGQALVIEFADGKTPAVAAGAAPKRPRKPLGDADQSSLF